MEIGVYSFGTSPRDDGLRLDTQAISDLLQVISSPTTWTRLLSGRTPQPRRAGVSRRAPFRKPRADEAIRLGSTVTVLGTGDRCGFTSSTQRPGRSRVPRRHHRGPGLIDRLVPLFGLPLEDDDRPTPRSWTCSSINATSGDLAGTVRSPLRERRVRRSRRPKLARTAGTQVVSAAGMLGLPIAYASAGTPEHWVAQAELLPRSRSACGPRS